MGNAPSCWGFALALTMAALPAQAQQAGEAFPLPRPGMEITFRIETNRAERYALMRFVGNEGERYRLERRAWEGSLSMGANAPINAVVGILDEYPGATPTSTCSLNVSDRQLRTLTVGAKLTYQRNCTNKYANGKTAATTSTIERVVTEQARITTPAGIFDALVVRKTTRTIYKGRYPSGEDEMTETTESVATRWFVPALGFYVRDQSRSRVVDRAFAPAMIEFYRRTGEAISLPKSTPWADNDPMVAVSIK